MKFQHAYTDKKDQIRPTIITGKGLTEQTHERETDINWIVRDYAQTQLLKHVNKNEGSFDDVSAVDFEQSMYKVAEMTSLFEGLPSKHKKYFENDPAKFLHYVQNPDNAEQIASFGIDLGHDGLDIFGNPIENPVGGSELASEIALGVSQGLDKAAAEKGSDEPSEANKE